MPLDPEIFKAYDVRGLYGSQIDGDGAEQIGRAFARVLGTLAGKPTSALRVALGHDMRLTAPELHARYRTGLIAEGVHVLDAGEVATEVVYYLIGSRELDGGLICTASHNPKAYTGAKLIREGAMALSGDSGIGDIRDLIAAGLPASARRRQRRAGRLGRRLPRRRDGLHRHRRGRRPAGRARRRQRHGRPNGRADPRPPRAAS